jgi:hypothetical protein
MGLKGYGLWVMGQLDSNVQSPTVASVVSPTRTVPGWNSEEVLRGEGEIEREFLLSGTCGT